MLSGFALDYVLWVFAVALGVVQAVCAMSGLRGLLFAREAPVRTNATGGLGLAAVATVWYFLDERRNLPDTSVGLDANVQAFWFAVAGAAAIALTLAVTSVVNHRWGADHGWDPSSGAPPPEGLGWLARTTFFRAARARAAFIRGRLRRNRAGI